MSKMEGQDQPIWAAAKANKRIDILKEVAKSLAETDVQRAHMPVARMTERDLEAEQLRLEETLREGTMTVEHFRRLQEIDYFLEGMRERKYDGPSFENWHHESLTEEE